MFNPNLKPPSLKLEHTNLLRITLAGKMTTLHKDEVRKFTDQVYTAVQELYKRTGQKVNFLTDLKGLEVIEPEVMDVYSELLKKDLPYVNKSATFGSSVMILEAFATLSVLSARSNFRHFATREEALEYLFE
ncbi:MAG: hypothetical protein Q8P76_00265 [bacterium]|nr:hypothetical protein [bacterium]